MYRGHRMLVIIIQRFLHSLKTSKVQAPQGACTVVFVENMLRKIQMILPDHTMFVNFQHHTAGTHEQSLMLFLRQIPGLIRCIVDDDLPDLKGMMIHQTVIAAHQIRSGCFRFFQKLIVIVR